MDESEDLLTMFSAAVEIRDGTPVVDVPARELELGGVDVGENYRVAVIRQPHVETDSEGRERTHRDQQKPPSTGPPVEEGERREVEVEDLGEQGDGIARVGPGYIVFVPGTAIGDRVTVEISEARENFAFAEVVDEEPFAG